METWWEENMIWRILTIITIGLSLQWDVNSTVHVSWEKPAVPFLSACLIRVSTDGGWDLVDCVQSTEPQSIYCGPTEAGNTYFVRFFLEDNYSWVDSESVQLQEEPKKIYLPYLQGA